jgi:ribosomal-protein-serine acetyltransferase
MTGMPAGLIPAGGIHRPHIPPVDAAPSPPSTVGPPCAGRRSLNRHILERVLHHELTEDVNLRLLEESDADALYAVIAANRPYLARWLPWAAGETRDATLGFIRATRRQIGENDGLQTLITREGRPIGMVGFHGIDWRTRSSSIGYWIAQDQQGQGIITRAVPVLLDHAFGAWRLNRIEIRVGVENLPSRGVPERLGFRDEGRLLQAERVGERWVDHVLYAMLAADWRTVFRERALERAQVRSPS